MRSAAMARPATAQDLDALTALCLEARVEAGTGSALCTDDEVRLRSQLAALAGLPGGLLLTAGHEGAIDGVLLARVVGPSPFSDVVVVDLEAVFVRAAARRRGVGHALLSALADEAEARGAAEVYASPLPGARGMQRFLARSGFQAAAAHRAVSTAALQRRLAQDPVAPRTGQTRRVSPRGLDSLIALRRRARGADAAGTAIADLSASHP